MADLARRERLQPSLLDRLTDHAPAESREADDRRTLTRQALRQAVLRDLGALFNAVTPLDGATVAAHPGLAGTVLDFGLPPLAGQLASKLDLHALERLLRQTILRFEPRLLAETLRVRALEATSVLDTHNVVEFEITGHLWSEPVPLEVLLRTQIDLEAGQVRVVDAGVAGRPPALSPKG